MDLLSRSWARASSRCSGRALPVGAWASIAVEVTWGGSSLRAAQAKLGAAEAIEALLGAQISLRNRLPREALADVASDAAPQMSAGVASPQTYPNNGGKTTTTMAAQTA